MNAIKTILSSRGRNAELMEIGESVTVEPTSQALMPIVIEKTDESELSVGHYYKQAGDLMSDPEVHFKLIDQNWIPVRFIQDPDIERGDPSGLEMSGFLEIWDRNLRRQGFLNSDGV